MISLLRLLRILSFWIKRGGNLKKECIVWPPMFTAATPVGAKTATFFAVFFLKYLRRVDLPLPALPVIKMLSFVFSIKLKAPTNSSFNSKLSGRTFASLSSLFLLFSDIRGSLGLVREFSLSSRKNFLKLGD